jgi:hypothetical protein
MEFALANEKKDIQQITESITNILFTFYYHSFQFFLI